jgi:hypothetical protein
VEELESVKLIQSEKPNPAVDDLEILSQILAAIRKLDQEGQKRMIDTVATFLGILPKPGVIRANVPAVLVEDHDVGNIELREPSFSEDRSISPKQFMFDKQPITDVEKVACLGFYLTHYRDTPHFRTLDISKLNTESAQIKFTNAAVAVENAAKMNYLVPAIKGAKQLSALGEQFVMALPDRDKARGIMKRARPRRRSQKNNQPQMEG